MLALLNISYREETLTAFVLVAVHHLTASAAGSHGKRNSRILAICILQQTLSNAWYLREQSCQLLLAWQAICTDHASHQVCQYMSIRRQSGL